MPYTTPMGGTIPLITSPWGCKCKCMSSYKEKKSCMQGYLLSIKHKNCHNMTCLAKHTFSRAYNVRGNQSIFQLQ